MRHKSMVQMSKKDWIEQKLVPNPDGEIIVETPIISRAHAGGCGQTNSAGLKRERRVFPDSSRRILCNTRS